MEREDFGLSFYAEPVIPLEIARDRGTHHALVGGTPGTSPLLRWAGSKKKLVDVLLEAAPTAFKRYVEPFVGSGILFLALNPRKAILSDLNPHLIQAYEQIRLDPSGVWETILSWPATEAFYYQLRSLEPSEMDSMSRAARFVYLNRYCFNGVYRTNRQGKYNVSRGKGCLGVPELAIFESFADRIRAVQLSNCDFESTLRKTKAGDFVYLDPPYAEVGKRNRGEYGAETFDRSDIDRLISASLDASNRGAKILLSYSADQLDLSRFDGWYVYELTVLRNISGFTGTHRRASEVLISNYDWRKQLAPPRSCSSNRRSSLL